jgi:undecaprenyl-diphosphatase
MTQILLRLSQHDQRALAALVSRRQRWLDTVMRAITHLGGATATIVVATALVVAGSPAFSTAGARATFALVASHGLVQLLKRSVARPRPRLPVGLESMVAAPDRFSFPSGHAAAALSVALAMVPVLPTLLAILGVATALIVGISRCYLGVHYPGDVLAGWVLAAAGVASANSSLAFLAAALGPIT